VKKKEEKKEENEKRRKRKKMKRNLEGMKNYDKAQEINNEAPMCKVAVCNNFKYYTALATMGEKCGSSFKFP
jgi:hypothetical protein